RSEYDGMLLDFNERTQPPNRKASQVLEKFVKGKKLQAYPEYFDLEEKIAKYAGVSPEQVLVTNGSNQGIDIIFQTFTEKGDKVIIPGPSFTMFEQRAQVAGNKIIRPLYKKSGLSFPLEGVLDSIDEQVKLLVVCNPNNPTGTAVSLQDIERIARKAKKAIVYVDEAYFEFSKITAIPLLKKYPNIIITRTFSKAFGLASLRIGYVIAAKEYVAEMLKVRGPYDVNMAAYYLASAALQDKRALKKYVEEVMEKAKPLVEKFFTENNILFEPSAANFILFRPANAQRVWTLLAENGVLARPQNKKNIRGTLRLTIGTVKQMKKFLKIYQTKIIR
ncbi:histidinol-phosphate transaminase, partial [Patescibacteria group bacterium]|nr:histidinol-phosphate transaminase [Patescibacteria group bacterium]